MSARSRNLAMVYSVLSLVVPSLMDKRIPPYALLRISPLGP